MEIRWFRDQRLDILEMIVHGFCQDQRHAAREGVLAGVDMEMESTCYLDHMESLVESDEVPIKVIDGAVRAILRLKFRLGLFENAILEAPSKSFEAKSADLATAQQLARESCVLLKNDRNILPLKKNVQSVAVIGALADSPTDQIGCWAFDRHLPDIRTPLAAIQETVSADSTVRYVRAFTDDSQIDMSEFDAAMYAATLSDVSILFLGERERLSGEAHCRAFLDLPSSNLALVKAIHALGKQVVVVLLTGRPLTIPWVVENIPALLVAWHPGSMGGPAIADLLFGDHAPSGKLPATFPRTIGQIPIYYNHKNTGRPPIDSVRKMPMGTPLDPVGFCSCYLDVDPTPQFPFGFGLSYSTINYGPTQVVTEGSEFLASATVTNQGTYQMCEVVQLYVCDLVGSVTRPVKELKDFQRVGLAPGKSKTVKFRLSLHQLAFHHRSGRFEPETGEFHAWIAGDSNSGSPAVFTY